MAKKTNVLRLGVWDHTLTQNSRQERWWRPYWFVRWLGKGGVKELYSQNPKLSVSDYRIIRLLHEWKTGSPISSDILYYICLDEHGAVIDPAKTIGYSSVSFNLYFPQAILYQVARQMMTDTTVLMQSQSFFALTTNESARKCNLSSTDPNHWHNIVSNFNLTEQKVFKNRLLQALINDTVQPRPDETTIQYLQRKGQRRSELSRHGILGKKSASNVESKKERRNREIEMEKWKKIPAYRSVGDLLAPMKCQRRGLII